jgi:hypothetical protein
MKVSGVYPSFISGVSQQTLAFRLPTQLTSSTNFYPTIIGGLKKRPPTELVAALLAGADLSNSFIHVIERSATERYVAVFYGAANLKVFNFDGVEQPLTITPSGVAYLTAATQKSRDLRAVSVADYTFVTNRKIVTAMAPARSPSRPFEALINIRQGNYGRTFRVIIDGVTRATYTAPDGSVAAHTAQIDTQFITDNLMGQLTTALPPLGFTVTKFTTCIHISSATDFSLEFQDGADGAASRSIKGIAQQLTDLPRFGPIGFTVEIVNGASTGLDNFWAVATKDPAGSASVAWRESTKPNTVLGFDATTMPHTLRLQPDASWVFGEAAWDSRKAGDGSTIGPDPSFVGTTINDITLFRQRLGFLADENVVFSRASSFFDFFRTTATQLLDDDPIDLSVSHDKISVLHHALPHQDSLFVFSGQTQFRVGASELFTPRTAAIRAATEYSCSDAVRPASVGSKAYFLSEDIPGSTGSFTSVYEVSMDNAYQTVDVSETTAHIPSYIPGGVRWMEGCADESMLFIISDGAEEGTLFCHRWYWAGNEKIQNAYFKWDFPGARIIGVKAIASTLFLFTERRGQMFIEKIRLNPDEVEVDLEYQLGLDQKIRVTTGALYDANTKRTRYRFTFPQEDGIVALASFPSLGYATEREVADVDGVDVYLRGDTTSSPVYFGYPYEARAELTAPSYRGPENNGFQAFPAGRLQVAALSLAYDRSGYFRLGVSTPGRDTRYKEFINRVIGDPRLKVGISALQSGRISIPVLSRAELVTLSIDSNSYLPCAILSGEWTGVWNPLNKQT